jgi:hypothetical protein
MSRFRIAKVDSMFTMDSTHYRPCNNTTMDVIAILLGDADGNYATVGTNAKGKLSGTVTLDGRNAIKINQDTFKIPIYASERMFGLDVKIEQHSTKIQILSISSTVAMMEKNIDASTKSCYLTGYASNTNGINANTPIGYLTIKTNCPFSTDFGTVTSYLNGQLAVSDVTSNICTGTVDPNEAAIRVFPNPTNALLTIYYGDKTPTALKIFNGIGSLVQIIQPTAEQTVLDMSGFADGVYFVKVDDKTFKIVKK